MNIREIIKPGDVVGWYTPPKLTWRFWEYIASKFIMDGISAYQRRYFGPNSDFHSYHVTPVLGPDNILNAKPPTVLWSKAEDLDGEKIKIFRPKFYNMSANEAQALIGELNKPVIYSELGMTEPLQMIGDHYEWEALLGMVENADQGSPDSDKSHWYDNTQKKVFCSSSTTLVFEHLRKLIMDEGQLEPYPPMFSQIPDPLKFSGAEWSLRILIGFKGVPWSSVTPGHFCNQYWNNPFDLIYDNTEGG